MRVTLIDPISFPKHLRVYIVFSIIQSVVMNFMSSSLESKGWFCFFHADLVCYFGPDEHWTLYFLQWAWNTVGLLVKQKNDAWTKNRKMLVELWWTNRVNIELWPFSFLQIHLFYHGFHFTYCTNCLLLISFESNRNISFPGSSVYLLIFTN